MKRVGESIFTELSWSFHISIKKGSQVMTVGTFRGGSLNLSGFPLLAIFVTALFTFMLSRNRRRERIGE